MTPNRKALVGKLFSEYEAVIKQKLHEMFDNWITYEKAVLSLNETDDRKQSDVVNFIVVFRSRSMFSKSLYTGDTVQDAKLRANQAQRFIYEYDGKNAFAGIASDNTQSCMNMRQIVVERNFI